MPMFVEGKFEEFEYWDNVIPTPFTNWYDTTDGQDTSHTRNDGWVISKAWEKHTYTKKGGWTGSNKAWEGNTTERHFEKGK